jgi:ketosteroid isomerase-like protein
MSQENVAALKRMNEAGNRGDIDALLQELDPNVEWYPSMQALLGGGMPVYRRHEGVRAMFRDFYDAFAEIHIELSDIRDLGDRTVAIGRLQTRGKESGALTESPWGAVGDFRNGAAIRIRTYLNSEQALAAAGLRE